MTHIEDTLNQVPYPPKAMQLRVRGPNGQSSISIDDNATVAELISTIAEKTGLPSFDLKYGFPPKPLDLNQFDALVQLKDTGLNFHGEQITAIPHDISGKLNHPLQGTTPKDPPPLPGSSSQPVDRAPSQRRQSPQKRTAKDISKDPPQIPVPSHQGTLVLRVMPDDNSCLFRAIGTAVLPTDIDSMHELRSLVAQTIQENPEQYNEAVLEQKPDEYCKWIQMQDSWGGGIELSILSQAFDVEIDTVDVKTQAVIKYNEGSNRRRVVLVYSSIHYDTIALCPSSPPYTQCDPFSDNAMKQFSPDDDDILFKAQEMCKELAKANYYFDAKGSGYRCKTCGWKGGWEELNEHVAGTGHTDMEQA